jgi:hypothetical protein
MDCWSRRIKLGKRPTPIYGIGTFSPGREGVQWRRGRGRRGAYGGVVLARALGVVVVGERGVAADPLAPHRRRRAGVRCLRRRHRPPYPSGAGPRKISVAVDFADRIRPGSGVKGEKGLNWNTNSNDFMSRART